MIETCPRRLRSGRYPAPGRRGAAVAVGALTALGCGGGESGGASEPLPVLVAEETLRIGSVDDPETSLTSFRALEIGPDGRIYTLHQQGGEVRIHAPDGAPLGSLGGEGEGPGEFVSPSSIMFRDGELLVYDSRQMRTSIFDADGSFLRDMSFVPRSPSDPSERPMRASGILRDGSYIGAPPVFAQDLQSGATTTRSYFRLDENGAVLDTIATHPFSNVQIEISVGDGGVFIMQPFTDTHLFATSPARMESVLVDRTVREEDPSVTVTKFRVGEGTAWVRDYPYEPVPLGGAAVDSTLDAWATMLSDGTPLSRNQAADGLRDGVVVPAHWPPVTLARIGRDGSVWLSMADPDPAAARWLVLAPDGEPHGEVWLPERLQVMSPSLGDLWGMDFDDLDIPYIVRLELTRSP